MRWNNCCKKWYVDRGYKYTKDKGEFEVDVNDLPHGSWARVVVKCDDENCINPLLNLSWYVYTKYLKEDRKYYCVNCAKKRCAGKGYIASRLIVSSSFEQWCIEYDRKDLLERWDYELNNEKPSEVLYGTKKKYYFICPNGIHKSEPKSISTITQDNCGYGCNQCNSFGQWCVDNNKNHILERWDYKLNENITPFDISYGSGKKYWFKCLKGIHKSELKIICSYTSGQEGAMDCNACNSFEQWCIDHNRLDILSRWDYKINKISPQEVTYGSNQKFYFLCPNKVHNSELKRIGKFTNGQEGSMQCNGCNSFAQWGIDNICEDFLEKYWDYEKNEKINPWEISKGSNKKVWIKCQEKDYHESYLTPCNSFLRGARCPYCCNAFGTKVHPKDSLAGLFPTSTVYWSDKNIKLPEKYSPFSKEEVWWRCHNKKHDDYLRVVSLSSQCEFRCPECNHSRGESKIQDYLNKNKIKHIIQKEFYGLRGLNGGNLSYDFYLPQHNLLIEYQGEQHERYIRGFHRTKKDFEGQLEHDKRKREYAKEHNIKLLEIWYWDFNNIEQILKNNLNI